MTFSPFDKRLLDEGLDYFARPRLASLLEMLGTTRFDRVETLFTMMRNCPPEEFDEALAVFERAAGRAERERENEESRPRHRRSRSAERRAQRRRAS